MKRGWASALARALFVGGVIGGSCCDTLAQTPTAHNPPAMRLVGEGTLRFFGLRVYEARLWADPGRDPSLTAAAAPGPRPGTSGRERPFDQPFVLELEYALALEGHRIAERSEEEMIRIGQGSVQQRTRWLAQMRTLFPNVRAGDRIAGHYRPGGASTFFINDQPLGVIDDPDFGRAFFGIWLDARTSEPKLRERLLRAMLEEAAVSGEPRGVGR